MTYWDHNLALLEKNLPAIYDWMVQQDDQTGAERTIRPATTEEADEWFADLATADWYAGIILGFGDGDHIDRLVRDYPANHLYIIEPEPAQFINACHARDLEAVITKRDLSILLIHEPDARIIAARIFQSVREHMALGRIVTLNWPPYLDKYADFWKDFHGRISENIKQEATNAATYRRYSVDWQANVWKNLPYALTDPGVGAMFMKFLDVPAILVSSGPSLEKNIDLLREVKDKALVVAAGSAIEPLRQVGITPDLVLTFDASEQNIEPFRDNNMPDLPLVYSGVVYPEVVAEWTGPRWVMGVDVYPFEHWLYRQLDIDKGEVSSGPSVANVTWDLLMRLGCNPIALVGQDLALTNGRSHATGVSALTEVSPDIEGDGYEKVMGVDGEEVLTTTIMLTMKTWFEQRIAGWKNAQLTHDAYTQKTIDCTEGGAKIDGTEIMTLRAYIDEHCQKDLEITRRLADLHAAAIPEPPETLPDLLTQIHDGLAQIQAYCKEAIPPLERLYSVSQNGAKPDDIFPLARELAMLDRKLTGNELHRQFLEPALRQYAHNYTIMSNEIRNEDDPKKAAELLVNLYASYFADTQRMLAEVGAVI